MFVSILTSQTKRARLVQYYDGDGKMQQYNVENTERFQAVQESAQYRVEELVQTLGGQRKCNVEKYQPGRWLLGSIPLSRTGEDELRERKLFPLRQKCDNTHKKDTLQAHYKHLESFCLHKYTFKPSHQVKYRQEKRNRNSGLNTVRRW